MKRLLFVVLATMGLSARDCAEGRTFRVNISGESNTKSQEMVSSLMERVRSTQRYSLTDMKSALILVSLNCFKPTDSTVVCGMNIEYYPEWAAGFHTDLVGAMVVGGESTVPDKLFNSFVESTTDDGLKQDDELLRKLTANFEKIGYDKGYQAGLTACHKQNAPKKPTN